MTFSIVDCSAANPEIVLPSISNVRVKNTIDAAQLLGGVEQIARLVICNSLLNDQPSCRSRSQLIE